MPENTARPLLPQTAQMQNFSFAPPTLAPRENQRNYVFVDEHNRHKRLKVMRACEGCRRRKIKCDAATTNAWPCAACIRLKLNCIPPTVSYDKDYNPTSQTYELDTKGMEYPSPVDGQHHYQRHSVSSMPQGLQTQMTAGIPGAPNPAYAEGLRMYQNAPYIEPPAPQQPSYTNMPPPPTSAVRPSMNYATHQIYNEPATSAPGAAVSSPQTDNGWRNDSVSSLAEFLGELQIDFNAVAPYITNQKKNLAEAPAQKEYELQLPASSTLETAVRIPPEMMPSEEQALAYFDYFFTNIHPYCPVVNKSQFYQQWQMARDSISPLLLEAIFACASVMLEPVSEGNKWLALASKHEESFKDVSRLSTMQAMLLLMKARESSPQRGYFWRSWMNVVSLVAMGKDLELDEHYDLHRMEKSCRQNPSDCITKSRVWHMLFILEVMVGGPQGRYDLGVDLDTVDFEPPKPSAALDSADFQVSRQLSQYMKIVKEIHRTILMYGKLRKKHTADWALDPDFVAHNKNYLKWAQELPDDMQIVFPQDGSPPWIPSHYVANMHSYYYLGIIMHHRPQLHAIQFSDDSRWKENMVTCYSAAKKLCTLQEAILKMYGLPGLLCMQRGISFTVYAILTCTMLHLVAITCPDPALNIDAREFFVRHMRILETCAPAWPMPEMQQQVNNLRQAFSADTSKPFELKPSFPFGSPSVANSSSPMNNETYRTRHPSQPSPLEQPGQVHYHTHPITPPISTPDHDSKTDSPVAQSLVMMAQGQRPQQASSGMQMQEPVQWNPQKIFDSWNVAFGTPPPSASSQSSPPLRPAPTGNYDFRNPQESNQSTYQQLPPVSPHSGGLQGAPSQLPAATSYPAPGMAPFVSPAMWQEAVASSFPDNKRRWDHSSQPVVDSSMYKRAR